MFKTAIRMLRTRESRARDYCFLDEDLASAAGDLLVTAACDEWVNDHLELITAMRALPRRQCEVIALRYLADYTISEIGQILGVDQGTVKKHLSRGLENLRHSRHITPPASTRGKSMS
jgi:RNA polymerase sigma factor (sigma-70 family)